MVGWVFFEKLQGYDNNLMEEFTKNFVANLVDLWGHTITITISNISSMFGFPTEGNNLLEIRHLKPLLWKFHSWDEEDIYVYATQGNI